MNSLKLLATLFIFTSAFVSCKCLKSKEKTTDLENTNWSLVKTSAKIYTANEENPQGITLSFKDGIFSTSDGCNGIGGEFSTEKNTISFDKVRNSMRYCDKEFMDKYGYDISFFLANKFEIKGNKLFLYQKDGKTLVAEYVKK